MLQNSSIFFHIVCFGRVRKQLMSSTVPGLGMLLSSLSSLAPVIGLGVWKGMLLRSPPIAIKPKPKSKFSNSASSSPWFHELFFWQSLEKLETSRRVPLPCSEVILALVLIINSNTNVYFPATFWTLCQLVMGRVITSTDITSKLVSLLRGLLLKMRRRSRVEESKNDSINKTPMFSISSSIQDISSSISSSSSIQANSSSMETIIGPTLTTITRPSHWLTRTIVIVITCLSIFSFPLLAAGLFYHCFKIHE